MSSVMLHPSEKWEIEKELEELGTRKPSITIEELEEQVDSEEKAREKGRADGISKRSMDPEYLKLVQTDKHSIGYAYAEAYKRGREQAYRKTGSNRRKTRKYKKQAKKSRKHRKHRK